MLRPLAIASFLALAPVPAHAANAMPEAPAVGDVLPARGWCHDPTVLDNVTETLLNDGERAATVAYRQYVTLRACVASYAPDAEVLAIRYRAPWPGRPDYDLLHIEIRLPDGRTGYVLAMAARTEA